MLQIIPQMPHLSDYGKRAYESLKFLLWLRKYISISKHFKKKKETRD